MKSDPAKLGQLALTVLLAIYGFSILKNPSRHRRASTRSRVGSPSAAKR